MTIFRQRFRLVATAAIMLAGCSAISAQETQKRKPDSDHEVKPAPRVDRSVGEERAYKTRRDRTLSEHESLARLAAAGVPVARSQRVDSPEDAVAAAEALGGPVALKLCGQGIAHKTERGAVRLGLGDASAVHQAATELLRYAHLSPGFRKSAVNLLVQSYGTSAAHEGEKPDASKEDPAKLAEANGNRTHQAGY